MNLDEYSSEITQRSSNHRSVFSNCREHGKDRVLENFLSGDQLLQMYALHFVLDLLPGRGYRSAGGRFTKNRLRLLQRLRDMCPRVSNKGNNHEEGGRMSGADDN